MSISSRKETERTKFIQEKCQTLLTQMLRDEDNKYCVDCDAKGPRWASWNLGVFLCIRCAGIHRNLGVHISRVKSVNLDSWTPDQVVSLQNMGNSRARAIYEAQIPDGFRRPQTDSTLESFIRAKYEHKKHLAREWVPCAPPKANWDKEIDEELERQKRKKKTTLGSGTSNHNSSLSSSSNSNSSSSSNIEKKSSSSYKSTPIPAPLPKPISSSNSPKSSRIISSSVAANTTKSTTTAAVATKTIDNNSASLDLLGLTSPTTTIPISSAVNDTTKSGNGINGDIFSNFLSASPSTGINGDLDKTISGNGSVSGGGGGGSGGSVSNTNILAKEEADFFNQIPNEKEKTKMSKDSILALYGTPPTNLMAPPQQSAAAGNFNNFNQFGNNGFAIHQKQQQQQHQQHNMFGGLANQSFIPQQQAMNVGFNNTPGNGMFGLSTTTTNGSGFPIQQQHQQSSQLIQQSFAQFPPQPTISSHPANPMTNFLQPSLFNQNNMSNGGGGGSIGAAGGTTTLPASNNTNLNQQFGNLSLGNVWQ